MKGIVMRKKFAGLGALLLLLLTAACGGAATPANQSSSSASSGSGELTDISVASINLLTFSPLFVADKLGYLKDEGLSVNIVLTGSGNASATALLGGSVQAATMGFDSPIQLAAKGQKVQSLAGMQMGTIYAFVGGPQFPDVPADDPQAFVDAMKGKKFGVASAGSTGDTIARGLFAEYGLSPDDVSIIPVGTGAAAAAALQSDAVDALISYDPDLTKMTAAGTGRIVFDLRNTKTETKYSQLPTSTISATTEWIQANPDTAAALVRAITKANNVLRTDPATALPVLEGLYPDLDAASVESAYKSAQPAFNSAITQDVYESALKIYQEAGSVSDPIPYSDVVATQFAKDWTAP
jgi:NitT/TauT family transport system substrate-binding protein